MLAPMAVQGEASEAATVAAYVAQIEQGLGEVVRRLEKKVDTVAQLLDQVGRLVRRHLLRGCSAASTSQAASSVLSRLACFLLPGCRGTGPTAWLEPVVPVVSPSNLHPLLPAECTGAAGGAAGGRGD